MSKKIAMYLFVIAFMAFALAGCGPSKEVQEALDDIVITNTIPKIELEEDISLEEAQAHIDVLEDSFNALILEIEEKYDYTDYIRNYENPSRLLAGEMKSISSAYKKVKDKALESAESDFEVSVKAVIDRIEDYSDAQKDELWQYVFDETVAPGKKLISDFE